MQSLHLPARQCCFSSRRYALLCVCVMQLWVQIKLFLRTKALDPRRRDPMVHGWCRRWFDQGMDAVSVVWRFDPFCRYCCQFAVSGRLAISIVGRRRCTRPKAECDEKNPQKQLATILHIKLFLVPRVVGKSLFWFARSRMHKNRIEENQAPPA